MSIFAREEYKPVLTSVSGSGVMEALQLLLTYGADINVAANNLFQTIINNCLSIH
jgi:hypothetical protein